jgi:D-glycero-D-manno-heptose 1,7-bisphosphate phosphatase
VLLHGDGIELDAWRRCLHHPAGVIEELAGRCPCRKPAPGLLIDAARELELDLRASWMIGDADSDIAAGRAAGCRTLLVQSPGSAHRRTGAVRPDGHTRNLVEAATFILKAAPIP